MTTGPATPPPNVPTPPPAVDELAVKRRRASGKLTAGAKGGNLAMVKEALAEGADTETVDQDGWTPLSTACAHAQDEVEAVVDVLLASRANPDYEDSRGRTPLFFAALEGLPGAVKSLLKAGATKVHTNDGNGVSAINHATRRNHIEVVKELLAARANPHQQDAFGGTAFTEASKMEEPEHAEIRRLHGHAPVSKLGQPGAAATGMAAATGLGEL